MSLKRLQRLSKEKREYIERHYIGDDDILVGLPSSEGKANEMCEAKLAELRQNGLGWNVGDVVGEYTVESVSFRIDYQDDSIGRIKQNKGETYIDYLRRAGKYGFYTACVCRRYKNWMNEHPYVYDDDISGIVNGIEGKDYKKIDDDPDLGQIL